MIENDIGISLETADLIYELAGQPKPVVVSDQTIREALIYIKNRLDGTVVVMQESLPHDETYTEKDWQKDLASVGMGEKRKMLIVDDIGVVTYQLKILFQKAGFEVETAKDIFNAIKLIRKHIFSFIVMDLFVSTEREGFLLLDETKKIIVSQNLDTKVIIITASNKGEHKVKCMNRGANMFLQKDVGWQEDLYKYVSEN